MENDVKDGSGIYYYASGEKYDGFFSDDVINGYGCYYFIGGHKYEQIVFIMILKDWYDGEKWGMGILQMSSGDQYKVEFYRDNFDGQGIHKI